MESPHTSSLQLLKRAGHMSPTRASDALPLPIRITNFFFFSLFFLSSSFLMRRWRKKIRTTTPLHLFTLSESLAVISLIASFIYLLGFFGIDYVQTFISHPSSDESWDFIEDEDEKTKETSPCIVEKSVVNQIPIPTADLKSDILDEDLIDAVVMGSLSSYSLESKLGDCKRAAGVRRAAVSRITSRGLEGLPLEGFDYASILGQCCEMPIGYVQVPVGVAGPLVLDGRDYIVPMATTEGCLVASTNRGCKAIAESGGAMSCVMRDGMSRAPVVRFGTAKRAA